MGLFAWFRGRSKHSGTKADTRSPEKHRWGCDLCAAEGYPNEIGHSTLSCEADRILMHNEESAR